MWLVAMLLPFIGGMANAAENPEHPSKSARKAVVMLAAMGLDGPEVLSLVKTIDERTKNGYLRIGETQGMGGVFRLQYALKGGVSSRHVELRFTPEDSHMVYSLRPDAATAYYSFKF